MPSRDKESSSIQAVENTIDVFEALSEINDDVRISQLSEKLAMNKTSVSFLFWQRLKIAAMSERESNQENTVSACLPMKWVRSSCREWGC